MKSNKKIKIITLVVAVVIVLGLIVFMFSGDNYKILQSLIRDDLTSEEFKELIQSFGIRGAVTLSLLSMLQVVFTFLPAEPVQVLSGIGYGFWEGFAICLVGVFLGNCAMYLAYKIFGDGLNDYFHKNIDLDFEKLRNSKRIAFFVFILYFLPAIPYGLICLFSASLDLKFPKYILLTTIGSIPSIFIGVGLGHMTMSASWIISVIVFAVLVTLIIVIGIKRKAVFAAVNKMIHKSQKEKHGDFIVKPAHPFTLFIVRIVFSLLVKKFKYKLKKNVNVKGPCIVICNHGSFYDFVFSALAVKYDKPQYMVARLFFYKKLVAWVLKKAGAFPKSMFSADMENMQNCMRVLRHGGVLVMMPEARLSTVGKFEGIQDTTFKFIKKMKVDLYTLKINGAYLASPKWGDKVRKGSLVECELNQLLTGEEIRDIAEEELIEKINTALDYDEFKWLESKPELKYKSKTLAVGLENILYKCPECGKECTLKTHKRTIICEECGLTATLNDRYAFVDGKPFKNFVDWYEWQSAELEKEILGNPNYELKDEVELKLQSYDGKKQLRTAGYGTCVFSRNGLVYSGTIDGETVEKVFKMKEVFRLLFGAGEDFEIYEGRQLYYFVPKDTRCAVKWYIASCILKEKA